MAPTSPHTPAARAGRLARLASAIGARFAVLAFATAFVVGVRPGQAAAQPGGPPFELATWGPIEDIPSPRLPLDSFSPQHIAIAPDGTLVVGDRTTGAIHRFDITGRRLAAWGGPGGGRDGTFRTLRDLDVGSDGHVWVLETLANDAARVQRFSPDGRFEHAWPAPLGSTVLAVAPAPFDHVVVGNCQLWRTDPLDGRQHSIKGQLHHFNQRMEPWPQASVPLGPLTCPYGMDIGHDGSIAVTEGRGGALYDPNGLLRLVFRGIEPPSPYPLANRAAVRAGSGGSLPERLARIVRPHARAQADCGRVTSLNDVAIAADGRILAADGYHCVHVFGADGHWITGWQTGGVALGIAMDGTRVWVGVQRATERIAAFDLGGRQDIAFGGARIDPPVDAFDRLADVATGPDGTVYVLDPKPHLVRRFKSGLLLPSVPVSGDPFALTVLPSGDIIVALNPGLTALERIDPAGARSQQRLAVVGLVATALTDLVPDGDDAVLAVFADGRVNRVGLDGTVTPLFDLGAGIRDYTLTDMVNGPDGTLIAAAHGRTTSLGEPYAVTVVDRDGTMLRGFGGAAAADGAFPPRVDTHLARLPDGTVLVAVDKQSAVRVFDPAGKYIGNMPDQHGTMALSNVVDLSAAGSEVWAIDEWLRLVRFGPLADAPWVVTTYARPWLFGWPIATEYVQPLAIDRRWTAAPDGANGVFARLDRTILVGEADAGPHVVDLAAGGGVRLWLDERLLLDGWAGPPNRLTQVVPLTAGPHAVRIEYWATDVSNATLRFDIQPFSVHTRLAFPIGIRGIRLSAGQAFDSPAAPPR